MTKSFFKDYFNQYDFLLIDLDGTLIRELDYLKQGYIAIGNLCTENKDLAIQWANELEIDFLLNGRKQLFDRFKERHSLDIDVQDMLKVLRTFTPHDPIAFQPKLMQFFNSFLSHVSNDRKVIFTAGNVEQQRNKVEHLIDTWEPFIVVYCGSTPKLELIEQTLEQYECKANKCLYIGDSWRDKLAADHAKVNFWHVNNCIELIEDFGI